MTEYLSLLGVRNQFFEEYEKTAALADATRDIETASCINLQRLARGVKDRIYIAKKHYLANEIQRVFRGHLGRTKSANELKLKLNYRQVALFHYFCIKIQKQFRGFHSRKHKQSYYRRKEYKKFLLDQAQKVKEAADKYADEQMEREAIEAQQQKEKEFRAHASNLHHLVSTRQIGGVYNPSTEFVTKPTMNNVLVEDHIRGVVKDLLRTRGVAKSGLVTDINGTKKVPLKGLKYRLSIQASLPYDFMEQEKRKTKTLHKIITRDKGDFFAGGKTKVIDKETTPLSVGDPYMDPWANPMLVKGVPKSQSQLLKSTWTRKALFNTGTQSEIGKPFVSRVGGNRSTALPNDVFDTIADAQETGGAIQRHLGTATARFGLPANADNRYDGTIPAPPPRTSSIIKSTRPRNRSYKDETLANAKNSAQLKSELKLHHNNLRKLNGEEVAEDSEDDTTVASKQHHQQHVMDDNNSFTSSVLHHDSSDDEQ